MSDDQPTVPAKPELRSWLEQFLPFKIPRIPLPQAAKNLDKALAAVVLAGGDNIAGRIQANTARHAARSDSEVALIRHAERRIVNDMPLEPSLEERAMQYALGDILRSQENRERIVELAAEELSAKAISQDASKEIDSDWLDAFSKYASQKSNEDVRRIWAKILASEIRGPGSISLRTLDFLSTINSEEANRIVRAFGFVIDNQYIPKMIERLGHLSYIDLLFLQELNIISGLYGVGGHSVSKRPIEFPSGTLTPSITTFVYRDQLATFEFGSLGKELRVEALVLSQLGRELYTISDAIVLDRQFFKDFCLKVKTKDISQIILITPTSKPPVQEVIFP